MNFLEVVKNNANKGLLIAKKHSPEILAVAGVVGVVTSTVLACKATTKIEKILDEHKETMAIIRVNGEFPEEEYTEEDQKKDTVITYTRTAARLAKLYAPAVGLGVVSLGCLLASNKILRKRNAALGAALIAADKAFAEYRDRVKERFGEDVERQIRLGLKEEEIEKAVTDAKGKEKTVKEKVTTSILGEMGYKKYFTRANGNWGGGDKNHVRYFANVRQEEANKELRAKGFLTLNEVYRMLGFEETKAGMVVGWIYDPDHPNGDNYVEIDVEKVYIPGDTGRLELAYIFDFNVDGTIYDKISF